MSLRSKAKEGYEDGASLLVAQQNFAQPTSLPQSQASVSSNLFALDKVSENELLFFFA